jgi:hypothetical protein
LNLLHLYLKTDDIYLYRAFTFRTYAIFLIILLSLKPS